MNNRLKKGDSIPFVQVANTVLYSPNLSLKAKGLYSYMLAKPNNWNFSSKRIAEECKESQKTIAAILIELREIGLIQYIKLSNGRSEYTLYSNIVEPKGNNDVLAAEPKGKKAYKSKSLVVEVTPIRNKDLNKQRDLKNRSKKSFTDQEHKSDECDNSKATNQNGINNILKNLAKSKKVKK